MEKVRHLCCILTTRDQRGQRVLEVWKNRKMAGQQDDRMEAFRMEEWNDAFRLPYTDASPLRSSYN